MEIHTKKEKGHCPNFAVVGASGESISKVHKTWRGSESCVQADSHSGKRKNKKEMRVSGKYITRTGVRYHIITSSERQIEIIISGEQHCQETTKRGREIDRQRNIARWRELCLGRCMLGNGWEGGLVMITASSRTKEKRNYNHHSLRWHEAGSDTPDSQRR